MDKDKRKLVVSCIPCNKRVELPIDSAVLTFTTRETHKNLDGSFEYSTGHIRLNNFIAYPHILCKDCLGVADIEVINKQLVQTMNKEKEDGN